MIQCSTSIDYISDLPKEILSSIFKELSPKELATIAAVSKRFKEVSEKRYLVEVFCK